MNAVPRWLDVAAGYIGTHEIAGPTSNPGILGWAKKMGGFVASYFTDDDIPWCALFVNACLEQVGLAGTHSLAAASFLTWGLPLSYPAIGAVMVFTRPGGNHVGFYLGQRSNGDFRILGGNQGDTVSRIWMKPERLTGIRWPAAELLPTSGPVLLASDGQPVSANEA